MKSILERYKFDGVWHFTDRSNLDLIRQHGGLFSWGELQRRGIVVPKPGGNQWSHDADVTSDVYDFVHLAFVDDHPMQYCAKKDGRLPDPIWIKIDPSIILVDGVRFSIDVSNKAGVCTLVADKAKELIDFEVLFTHTDWRDPQIKVRRKAALKSEILVPRVVPMDKLLGFKDG
ncbi:DUF4433 domain-containing protein [Propionivibrio soli]|uniref:DUF4433 domain-containing protein n=1 Tax=Propionivibrio soli TaxID=2976531 RepID=UPI0021E78BC8|nr:DUF4433 domain-containing protein [Propionivibrio soli]